MPDSAAPAAAPALAAPGSRRVDLVCNAAAGSGDKAEVLIALQAALAGRGIPYTVHAAERGEDLPQAAAQAVRKAQAAGGVVVAFGGDGTINTVAGAAHEHSVAMGVMPGGTFNYFARVHGLPEDAQAAVALWAEGQARPVQLGCVNGQLFAVNSSVGLYPRLLRAREEDNARIGRFRLVAAWSALRTLLRENRSVRLDWDEGTGAVQRVRTPTLFVGNNPLQLEQFGFPGAGNVGAGVLAAIRIRPVSTWRLTGLALLGLMGRLGPAPEVQARWLTALTVTPRSRRLRRWRGGAQTLRPVEVAFDGEVRSFMPPLCFRVAKRPLWLIKP